MQYERKEWSGEYAAWLPKGYKLIELVPVVQWYEKILPIKWAINWLVAVPPLKWLLDANSVITTREGNKMMEGIFNQPLYNTVIEDENGVEIRISCGSSEPLSPPEERLDFIDAMTTNIASTNGFDNEEAVLVSKGGR